MENLPGAMGTGASFVLRVTQVVCSVAGVLFMCSAAGFYQFSSFRFLVIVMGVLIPWSTTLAVVDGTLVFIRALAPRPRIIPMVIIIDWILAMMSLAASCAAASTADFLYPHDSSNDTTSWSPHRLSAAVAFLCFAAMCGNALSNVWILPRL